MNIDLHMHSTHSDGKLTPKELVDEAIKRGLKIFAITDHDIVSGVEEAQIYAKNKDIEIITGVEFGADDEELELYDVHIVGLFIDTQNTQIQELVKFSLNAREIQKKEIINKLNELGYEITFEELQKEAKSINYGRPHIARILIRKYPNEFKTFQEVFDKLLANPKTAYIRQKKKSIKNTIDVIHNARGIAIFAHPGYYKNAKEIINNFLKLGGDGIELNYAYENDFKNKEKLEEINNNIKEICKNHNFIVSGGSDFHDPKIHIPIGSYGIDEKEFELMKNYRKEKFNL